MQFLPDFPCRRTSQQQSYQRRVLPVERSMRGNQHQVVISSTFSQLPLILSDFCIEHLAAKEQGDNTS